MTFGYGPSSFPHSAAHVLNTTQSPSSIEGEQINKSSTFTGSTLSELLISNFNGIKITHLSKAQNVLILLYQF